MYRMDKIGFEVFHRLILNNQHQIVSTAADIRLHPQIPDVLYLPLHAEQLVPCGSNTLRTVFFQLNHQIINDHLPLPPA
ncbi:hypothetical protein D3C75_1231740 [compost metagenome]